MSLLLLFNAGSEVVPPVTMVRRMGGTSRKKKRVRFLPYMWWKEGRESFDLDRPVLPVEVPRAPVMEDVVAVPGTVLHVVPPLPPPRSFAIGMPTTTVVEVEDDSLCLVADAQAQQRRAIEAFQQDEEEAILALLMSDD